MTGGSLIKEGRRRTGVSQRELARRLNTSQAAIARWESGTVKSNLESVERALRACALELRVNLVPIDDHDTQLDREQLRLTPDQRLRQLENHVALILEGTPPIGAVLTSNRRFQPRLILRELAAHDVRFVVIGGLAAALHGSSQVTFDIDIVPDPELGNLARLSKTLAAVEARIRASDASGGLPFEPDAASLLRAEIWNLQTRLW